MKKTIRLTESDLNQLVKKILTEDKALSKKTFQTPLRVIIDDNQVIKINTMYKSSNQLNQIENSFVGTNIETNELTKIFYFCDTKEFSKNVGRNNLEIQKVRLISDTKEKLLREISC